MFFLLYKHTDDDVFDDFPEISDHFPKISEDFLKLFRRPEERSRTFSENFRKFPKMSEDFRRYPKTFEEDPKMFPWYTNEFKYNLRDKLDITEIIDIFTWGYRIVFINLLPLAIPLTFIKENHNQHNQCLVLYSSLLLCFIQRRKLIPVSFWTFTSLTVPWLRRRWLLHHETSGDFRVLSGRLSRGTVKDRDYSQPSPNPGRLITVKQVSCTRHRLPGRQHKPIWLEFNEILGKTVDVGGQNVFIFRLFISDKRLTIPEIRKYSPCANKEKFSNEAWMSKILKFPYCLVIFSHIPWWLSQ